MLQLKEQKRVNHAVEAQRQSFGKFTLLYRLAMGGMGEIFLAEREQGTGEKLVVIKRILQSFSDNQDYLDMFFSEATVAAMLDHPNLVRMHDRGSAEGHLYIAMEYIHGRSLGDVIRRANELKQPLPLAYVAEFAAQACAGLGYAHSLVDVDGEHLNLVHRDVNPDNLLVNYNGKVKIIDFGIAKTAASQNLTVAGALKGKLEYMSPEQAASKPLDQRSDIFSLNIVLFELLTGLNPFSRDAILATLEAIQQSDRPPVAELRADAEIFEPILSRGLAADREQRYGSSEEMQADLKALLLSGEIPPPQRTIKGHLQAVFSDHMAAQRQELLSVGIEPQLIAALTDQPPVRDNMEDPSNGDFDPFEDVGAATIAMDAASIQQMLSEQLAVEAKAKGTESADSEPNSGLESDPVTALAAGHAQPEMELPEELQSPPGDDSELETIALDPEQIHDALRSRSNSASTTSALQKQGDPDLGAAELSAPELDLAEPDLAEPDSAEPELSEPELPEPELSEQDSILDLGQESASPQNQSRGLTALLEEFSEEDALAALSGELPEGELGLEDLTGGAFQDMPEQDTGEVQGDAGSFQDMPKAKPDEADEESAFEPSDSSELDLVDVSNLEQLPLNAETPALGVEVAGSYAPTTLVPEQHMAETPVDGDTDQPSADSNVNAISETDETCMLTGEDAAMLLAAKKAALERADVAEDEFGDADTIAIDASVARAALEGKVHTQKVDRSATADRMAQAEAEETKAPAKSPEVEAKPVVAPPVTSKVIADDLPEELSADSGSMVLYWLVPFMVAFALVAVVAYVLYF